MAGHSHDVAVLEPLLFQIGDSRSSKDMRGDLERDASCFSRFCKGDSHLIDHDWFSGSCHEYMALAFPNIGSQSFHNAIGVGDNGFLVKFPCFGLRECNLSVLPVDLVRL